MTPPLPTTHPQPWLYSRNVDLTWILAPAFVVSLAVLSIASPYPALMRAHLPIGAWFLTVLCIDVAHVYSTLFRTYLDPCERARHAALLTITPLACWISGVLLYNVSGLLFWSSLAYLAVFHFVRQQYGFYALYARNPHDRTTISRWIDTAAVYLATMYPLVFWHENLPRAFEWFIEGDFPFRAPHGSSAVVGTLLVALLIAVVTKEIATFHHTGFINLPKNLVIFGTALAWYTGIIQCNGDIPFTLTNVISHGVPYIALIWITGRKKLRAAPPAISLPTFSRLVFSVKGIGLFVIILIGLAFWEEALWDTLVWRERQELFGWLWQIPQLENHSLLSIIVPLLAVPQATHYVVDAFIWRIRKPHSGVAPLLFEEPAR